MSYNEIPNLYKNQDILLFKKCYALEKIHGTPAHIGWDGKVYYFSQGENYEKFRALFDEENLIDNFQKMNNKKVVIYGEAYGGKCQGMSATYGKDLKFIAFEVKIGDSWLAVPQAESIVRSFNLDFVPYVEIKTDLSELNFWRDAPSQQAVKCGIIEERKREGIVLRPLIEVIKNNGERIISKYKSEAFQETKTKREITQESLKVLTEATEIASEWVTPMRLSHVIDKFPEANIEHTGEIINAMIADVQKESVGEVVLSKEVFKEIGKKTALYFRQYLENKIKEVLEQ